MGHEAVRKCSVSQWKSECKKIRVKDSNKGRKLSTLLNKRVVILPREWWKNKLQGQSKEQNPPSPFIGSLSVRRVKQMLWEKKINKNIQYPANVILKVPVSVSTDCFTGEQAKFGQ